VRAAAEALGQETRAAFYLANGDGTSLRHVVGMSAEYAIAVHGFQIGPESLACGLATHTRKPILTVDVQEDPLWEPWRWLAERFGHRGCWSFPINTAAGKFIGSLAIYSRRPREATKRNLDLAALLTNTASIIISRHSKWQVRKEAEEALRESDARCRALLEGVAQAFWQTDARGVVVTDSPSWRAYTGQTVDEWMGYGWIKAIHPDDQEYAERQWRDAVASERSVDAEFRLRATDGSYRWTNVRAIPLRDQNGEIEK